MTAGTRRKAKENKEPVLKEKPADRISKLISSFQTPDEVLCEDVTKNLSRLGRKRPRPSFIRLVSQDIKYISETDDDKEAPLEETKTDSKIFSHDVPFCSSNPALIANHIRSLRLEAELFPMRQLIARLMSHLTLNRRGLFNSPVDTVALMIPDYNKIIKKPMDLGTVKARLHAVSYTSCDEVAEDIRLVFFNAMTYNPPQNPVHIAAKKLLRVFEESFQVLKATSLSHYSVPKKVAIKPQPVLKISAPDHSSVFVQPTMPCVTPHSRDDDNDKKNVQAVPPSPEKPVNKKNVSYTTSRRRSLPLTTDNYRKEIEEQQQAEKALKRAMNVAAKNAKHSCKSCDGRICVVCKQGCLLHEPSLLICSGSACSGAKIRKGATFYTAKDGSRQFCQRCYTNLQAVLPGASDQVGSSESSVRYKRDLLKRKNEEEVAEAWLTCVQCNGGVHKVCAMYDDSTQSEDNYRCPSCILKICTPNGIWSSITDNQEKSNTYYTFVSGSVVPVRLDTLVGSEWFDKYSAEALPKSAESSFIEACVHDRVKKSSIPNVEKTIIVRTISDCSKKFKIPDVIRKHFRQASKRSTNTDGVIPPVKVCYKSKAIALFQKIDGFDVCIFCMYVHEYDCKDEYESNQIGKQKKRVYIAYLDSVEHFRPRKCRSDVFQEIIIAYLATARVRGYESAHIWACPPSRGNSFVFWNHPSSQRTPTKERLHSWYHAAIGKGIKTGVITDVKSLFESSFPFTIKKSFDPTAAFHSENMKRCEDGVLNGRLICPPLMDGDFWIEEAVRLHATSIMRHLKNKPTQRETNTEYNQSPATQVAALLRDKVMSQDVSAPFRRPVNAAAMKLSDYHKIITEPMDLGTVYSKCYLGEYDFLSDLVADVELVFSNAMKYNPKGHFVHTMASDCQEVFFRELDSLTQKWNDKSDHIREGNLRHWRIFENVGMSLDNTFDRKNTKAETITSVDPSNAIVHNAALNRGEDEIFHINGPSPSPVPKESGIGSRLVSPLPKSFDTGMTSLTSLTSENQLISGEEDAIVQNMVGDDVWMLDKKARNNLGMSSTGKKKGSNKGGGKKRRNSVDISPSVEPALKRRRQSWLGEEVALSVRKMRTSFFSCSLVPKKNMSAEEKSKERDFKRYISSFKYSAAGQRVTKQSRVADSRQGLLEFSQYRNLEFDTLRRAKHSTRVLLHHFHDDSAPGLIPSCTSCKKIIQNVRWHRIRRVETNHSGIRMHPTGRKSRISELTKKQDVTDVFQNVEELCALCFEGRTGKEEFIPLQVSIKALQ